MAQQTEQPAAEPIHRNLTSFEKRACLSYWYPKTQHLPSPATKVLNEPLTLEMLSENDKEGVYNAGYHELIYRLRLAAGEMIGRYELPLFLRTGQTSGKHDWPNTCELSSPEEIESHVQALAMFSHAVDLRGLPLNVWAVREWLDIEHKFTAFSGMPIGREYRFFVQEGEILHCQPYWPHEALAEHATETGWKAKLDELNKMPPPYAAIDLANLVGETVANRFEHPDSCWSVDVCKTTGRGWYLTDMAPAERSFFWDPNGEYDSLSEKPDIEELNLPSK